MSIGLSQEATGANEPARKTPSEAIGTKAQVAALREIILSQNFGSATEEGRSILDFCLLG